jgi:hypothetical protein
MAQECVGDRVEHEVRTVSRARVGDREVVGDRLSDLRGSRPRLGDLDRRLEQVHRVAVAVADVVREAGWVVVDRDRVRKRNPRSCTLCALGTSARASSPARIIGLSRRRLPLPPARRSPLSVSVIRTSYRETSASAPSDASGTEANRARADTSFPHRTEAQAGARHRPSRLTDFRTAPLSRSPHPR